MNSVFIVLDGQDNEVNMFVATSLKQAQRWAYEYAKNADYELESDWHPMSTGLPLVTIRHYTVELRITHTRFSGYLRIEEWQPDVTNARGWLESSEGE